MSSTGEDTAVRLSELPPDVWRIITGYLSQSDLHSLSQVSKQLHDSVVADDLFRHYVLHRTDGVSPSNLLVNALGWRRLFARICSIEHSPRIETIRQPLAPPLRLVASSADDIVLYSETDRKLIGLPNGWLRDVVELCDDPTEFLDCTIQLPDACLGILQSSKGNWDDTSNEFCSKFSTISIRTGHTTHAISLALGSAGVSVEHSQQAMSKPKVLHLGGSAGQFLVYFIQNDGRFSVRVANRKSGLIVQTISPSLPGFTSLLRSVHKDTDEMLIVGVAERCDSLNNTGSTALTLQSFDGDTEIDDVLYVEEGCSLIDAVICLTSRVIAYRVRRGPYDVTLWRQQRMQQDFESPRQQLDPNTARFPVRMPIRYDRAMDVPSEGLRVVANGRKIVLMPHTSRIGDIHTGCVMRASFSQSGMLNSTDFINGRNEPSTLWSWGHSCMNSKVLVLCSKGVGLVTAFDLDRNRKLWSIRVWEEIADIAVVAEHYVVFVGGFTGELHVYHLNRFCSEEGSQCALQCIASQQEEAHL